MIKTKIIIIGAVIVLVFASLYYIFKLTPEKIQCYIVGGNWRVFSNTCVDACTSEKYPVCGMAITAGCDCGPDKCWNGYMCVKNNL
ncbi:hypothetical protein KJ855_00675 [Patescibacteria group bacterium]|nr:hypothetical protein [Patescibacteria group bacterium]